MSENESLKNQEENKGEELGGDQRIGSLPDSSVSSESHQASGNRVLAIILGILFILPAIAALVFSFIIPSIRTFALSFQDANFFSDPIFIGMENYQQLLGFQPADQAIIFTLLITLVRVIVMLFPPLFLAIGAAALKPGFRKFIRIVSSIPWMLYSPLALAITWMLLVNPSFGLGTRAIYLGNPDTARWIVLALDGLSFFGLSCGIGITVYLAILKGSNSDDEQNKPIGAMVVTAIILALGTIALSLQSGQTILLLTNGGPQFSTTLISHIILNQAFVYMRMGMAAAFASPLLLVVILIGIGLGILMVITQLQFRILPKTQEPVRMTQWVKVIGIILMAIVLLGLLFSILPFVAKWIPLFRDPGGFFASLNQVSSQPTFWKTVLNTWMVPLLIVLLIQFPITILGAIGIGALRPLGKASEWLLLLFAPWLVVSTVLLVPGYTRTLINLELINSYFGLLIPYLLNIPLLFILTLFYRGQVMHIKEEGKTPKFFKDLIVPSLPLIAIGLVFSMMVIQQDTIWSSAVLSSPDHWLLPIFFRRFMVSNMVSPFAQAEMLTLLRIPAFIASFLVLAAYQIFYFPRLGLRIKRGKKEKTD